MSLNPYLKETLVNWINGYSESDAAKRFPSEIQSGGPFFLQELILGAVEKSQELEAVDEKLLGEQLTELASKYDLSAKMKEQLPAFVGDFLEDLEAQGRLSDGRALGKFIRTFKDRLGPQTIRRPGSKIGRNDPCPCGSGQKFKKCCMGLA